MASFQNQLTKEQKQSFSGKTKCSLLTGQNLNNCLMQPNEEWWCSHTEDEDSHQLHLILFGVCPTVRPFVPCVLGKHIHTSAAQFSHMRSFSSSLARSNLLLAGAQWNPIISPSNVNRNFWLWRRSIARLGGAVSKNQCTKQQHQSAFLVGQKREEGDFSCVW